MTEKRDTREDLSSKRQGAERDVPERGGSGVRANGRSDCTIASEKAWMRVQDALAESMKRAAERKTWTTSST